MIKLISLKIYIFCYMRLCKNIMGNSCVTDENSENPLTITPVKNTNIVNDNKPTLPQVVEFTTTVTNNSSNKLYYQYADTKAIQAIPIAAGDFECFEKKVSLNKVIDSHKAFLRTLNGVKIMIYDLDNGSETVSVDGLVITITHQPSGDTDVIVDDALGG